MNAKSGNVIPPAFPRSYAADGHNGMNLRDYFAGQALAGLCANEHVTREFDSLTDPLAVMARRAYYEADAMLKAREGST